MLMTANENEFAPVTPGEMLREEFLAEYGLSQNQLAKALGISPNRIAEIVANRRRITADTALRLSLYFGNSPEFWMNLQTHYDVKMARRKLKPQDAKRIGRSVPRESTKKLRPGNSLLLGSKCPNPAEDRMSAAFELRMGCPNCH
jgi:addiction module HigA family antidote